jgi:hypothetical protein
MGLDGKSKDVWTERVRLLASYQVNADLTRKALKPDETACTPSRPSSSPLSDLTPKGVIPQLKGCDEL